jgi:hypothetical protein
MSDSGQVYFSENIAPFIVKYLAICGDEEHRPQVHVGVVKTSGKSKLNPISGVHLGDMARDVSDHISTGTLTRYLHFVQTCLQVEEDEKLVAHSSGLESPASHGTSKRAESLPVRVAYIVNDDGPRRQLPNQPSLVVQEGPWDIRGMSCCTLSGEKMACGQIPRSPRSTVVGTHPLEVLVELKRVKLLWVVFGVHGHEAREEVMKRLSHSFLLAKLGFPTLTHSKASTVVVEVEILQYLTNHFRGKLLQTRKNDCSLRDLLSEVQDVKGGETGEESVELVLTGRCEQGLVVFVHDCKSLTRLSL